MDKIEDLSKTESAVEKIVDSVMMSVSSSDNETSTEEDSQDSDRYNNYQTFKLEDPEILSFIILAEKQRFTSQDFLEFFTI